MSGDGIGSYSVMGTDSMTTPSQHPMPGAIIMAAGSSQAGSISGAQQTGSGSQTTGVGSQYVGVESQLRIRLSSQPAEAGLIPTKVAKVTTRVHRRAWRIDRFIFISGGGRKGQNRSN
jgi:hypothetical protein